MIMMAITITTTIIIIIIIIIIIVQMLAAKSFTSILGFHVTSSYSKIKNYLSFSNFSSIRLKTL